MKTKITEDEMRQLWAECKKWVFFYCLEYGYPQVEYALNWRDEMEWLYGD